MGEGALQVFILAGIFLAFIFWIASLLKPAPSEDIRRDEIKDVAQEFKNLLPPGDPGSVVEMVRAEFADLSLLFQRQGNSSPLGGGREPMPADPEIIRLWIDRAASRAEAKIEEHDKKVAKLLQYLNAIKPPQN